MGAQGTSMAARSTRGIQLWRWACLAALALLSACQSKSASSRSPVESMGAPAAVAPAEPAEPTATGARLADERAQAPSEPAAAAPGMDEPAAVTAPPVSGTPRPALPPPPSAPVAVPASRPHRPSGDTGRDRGEGQGHAGAGRSRPRPVQMATDIEDTATEAAARREDADHDQPGHTGKAQVAKNTEEPAPAPEPAPEPAAPQASPQASVEAFYASLPEQAIAFHVPRSVQRGEMFAVRLVVQPGQSEAALERVLVDIVTDAGPAPAPGDIRTRTTRIGDEMQASIASPTLQIVPRGEDRQLVRRDAVTEWVWDVTATTGGSHRLTLSLYAIPQGRSSGIKVKTFEETLTVTVTLIDDIKDTVANNWEWMWTFFLGPIGALAWRRRQRRHAQAG